MFVLSFCHFWVGFKLSEVVASFDNLPAEFQLFVNIDITEVVLADPGGCQTRRINLSLQFSFVCQI